ncbi:MAG: hypothetical protein F6K39_36065 [Okeania sp. SIO3B3]|nr:hypothetical protein [Okeania sp. SIO3B3]
MVRKLIHPSTAFYPLKRGDFRPQFFGNFIARSQEEGTRKKEQGVNFEKKGKMMEIAVLKQGRW